MHIARQQDLRSPLSKVLFDPAELALKVGNDSGMTPELGTETQVAQGEKTVQHLLCKLASVFSVRENHPQAANTESARMWRWPGNTWLL